MPVRVKTGMHGDKVLVVIEQEIDGGRRAEGSECADPGARQLSWVGLREKTAALR